MSANSCSAGHSTQKSWWKNMLFFCAKAGQGQYYKEGPAKIHRGDQENASPRPQAIHDIWLTDKLRGKQTPCAQCRRASLISACSSATPLQSQPIPQQHSKNNVHNCTCFKLCRRERRAVHASLAERSSQEKSA